jgi:hypothetical protein
MRSHLIACAARCLLAVSALDAPDPLARKV